MTNTTFAAITTTAVGGPIKKLISPTTQEELIHLLQTNPQYLVIGGGSNILASDTGVEGLVIQNKAQGIDQLTPTTLQVLSGTPLQTLVDYCIKNSLSGLEKLTGIPGTVGGALTGNAGAFGQNISDPLVEVKVFKDGKILALKKSDCQFGYRDSIFKHQPSVIISAIFTLSPSDKETLSSAANEVLQIRLKRWPKGTRCPGSFFKNIEAKNLTEEQLNPIPEDKIIFGKVPAGYLLEMVGAKGLTTGGVKVSLGHANAFINQGRATATDYWNLASELKQKVSEKFSIELEPEVQFINLPPLD